MKQEKVARFFYFYRQSLNSYTVVRFSVYETKKVARFYFFCPLSKYVYNREIFSLWDKKKLHYIISVVHSLNSLTIVKFLVDKTKVTRFYFCLPLPTFKYYR